MTQSTGTPGGDDSNPLANQYYVDGYNGSGSQNYNPDDINKAIKEEIQRQEAEISNGGHVSMGETMMLMYLMQGFGGEVVGQDGEASSALQHVQSVMSQAWDISNQTSSSGGWKPPTEKEFKKMKTEGLIGPDESYADYCKSPTEAFLAELDFASTLLGQAGSLIPPNEVDQITNSITAVKSFLMKDVKPGDGSDALSWIYKEAKPSGKTQGNPADLDSFTRMMTTVNQQVTGGSQVMSTQAKADSKTQQSEATAYNNYLQMIKKLLSYMSQLQRTG